MTPGRTVFSLPPDAARVAALLEREKLIADEARHLAAARTGAVGFDEERAA
jgi:hypothetical protein